MENNPFAVFNLPDDYKDQVLDDDFKQFYAQLMGAKIDYETWLPEAFLYASQMQNYDFMSIPYTLFWNCPPQNSIVKTIQQVFAKQIDVLQSVSESQFDDYYHQEGIIEFCLDILYHEESTDPVSMELAFAVIDLPWGCWEGDAYGVIKKAIWLIELSPSLQLYKRLKSCFPHKCEHINYALEVTDYFKSIDRFLAENAE